MRISVLLLALAGIAAGQGQPQPKVGALTTWWEQVVPLVIVGEGWSQRIVLTNVDDSLPAVGTIQFFTARGKAWTVSLTSGAPASVYAFSLQPGQTAVYETAVQQSAQVLGWALIQETTSGIGNLFGQTIFRKQTAGLPDFMCSHILGSQTSSRLTVFFDNTGGKYTGMGILTSQICLFSCTTPDSLRVTVRDLAGNILSQKIISQLKGVLYWMNLGVDFPSTNGVMGTFVVEPVSAYSTELTGFSLQFAPNGAFTAITPFEK